MSSFLAYMSACITALIVIAPFVIPFLAIALAVIIFAFAFSHFKSVRQKREESHEH